MPTNSAFGFCNQPGFRFRWNLHKVSMMAFQNHHGILMILHVCCFQVIQLTALVTRGPSVLHPVFTLSLDGVAISHEKVNGAVSYVQHFLCHPVFTQRNFFSETGPTMLNTADAAADVSRQCAHFDHWRAIGVEVGPVVTDLNSFRKKIVLRMKVVKVTREGWFGAESVASSVVGETMPSTTVRISDVVEVGHVRFFEEHKKLGPPCRSQFLSIPGKVGKSECQ